MPPTDDAATEAAEAATPVRPTLPLAKVAILAVALAFLGGSVGYLIGHRTAGADPLNAVDVGFMQDMGYHHDQAIEMSLILLDKEGLDPNFTSYATEIVIGQRYEQGIYSATLDRFGHSSDPGPTVMEWMGTPMPAEQMVGLATPDQMAQLREAEGDDAAALWIALMSEHHLAGLHMADYDARHGHDRTTVNLAQATVKNQRSEVVDLQRYRRTHDLPIPDGFTDPMEDQRLDPISFTDPPN